MARVLAYTRQLAFDPTDAARAIVVTACALVLIVARQALPL
jgi:hypothetical protein